MKRCEPEDFGEDAESQAFYHTWITDIYSFDLFCPDLDKQRLDLYNQKGAMKSKSIIFRVEKCKDPEGQTGYCKSDKEFKEFVNEVSVQLWVIESAIDMRYFHGQS